MRKKLIILLVLKVLTTPVIIALLYFFYTSGFENDPPFAGTIWFLLGIVYLLLAYFYFESYNKATKASNVARRK